MKTHDIIEVDHYDVVCDGGKGALGHPRVYLHVDVFSGQIQCPYCSKLYLLKADHESAA